MTASTECEAKNRARGSVDLVPLLTYHSLDDSGSVISMPPDVFSWQMQTLASRGYTGISLGELIDGWNGLRSLPSRPVVLTFDDGFRNLLDHAVPVLKKWGFRATVFAVAGHLGKMNDWPGQPSEIPHYPLLSSTELVMLAGHGIEIGAHSVTHRYFTRLSADEARRELLESKRILEQILGIPVTSFAYPYGVLTSETLDYAREYYRAACGVEMLPAHRSCDYHCIPRIDTFYLRRRCLFNLFGTSAGDIYVRLRGLGRKVRGMLTEDGDGFLLSHPRSQPAATIGKVQSNKFPSSVG